MRFKDALEAFNKSLCYSPLDVQRGSLHTHRAKAYLQSKLYLTAMKNVEMANSHGVAFATMETKRICENNTKYAQYPLARELHDEIMGLSYLKNPKIPFIVHCLKMEEDWKYGRHIIATQPLVTGDIVAIEDPFWQTMISPKHHHTDVEENCCYKRCYHCLRISAMNLMPCESCEIGKFLVTFFPLLLLIFIFNFPAMFCCFECKEDALLEYHGIECMLPKMIKQQKCYLRTYRPLFVALSLFEGKINDLEEFLDTARRVTVFDFNLSNKHDPMYRKHLFLAWWSLLPTKGTVAIAGRLEALRQHPIFRDFYEEKRDFLKQFLQKSAEIFKGNYFLLKMWPMDVGNMADKKRNFEKELVSPMMFRKAVGFGCFPFTSLLNHSCAPNCVSMLNKSGKMVTVVLRQIAKGGQLFVNYMNDDAANYFIKTPLSMRQLTLHRRFSFKCDCEACTLALPMFFLKWTSNSRDGEFMRNLSMDFMHIGPVKTTVKYRRECTLIGANFNQSPTEQMAMSTETLIHYFGLISYPFYKFPDY